ncbi:MAG: type I-MYXAN CRISPR-associated protein Cas6/Cmx6 [Pigmentiphaga sp.]|nr:type I-MYXAN CRISPR-associated protein Cas6/Cmx6 [Pigmentiphaga sp.]
MRFVTYTWPASYRSIPVDHGYALYGALSWALQMIHEGSWQVCPLAGKPVGRELRGPGTLQIRGPLAESMLGALNGQRMRVGSREMFLGRATLSEVKPARELAARFVTIKNATTEDALLTHLVERLTAMIGRVPEITIGRRRVMVIGSKRVVGFGVALAGLEDEESMTVQLEGLGGRRRMGGGVFLPHQSIQGRWYMTPHAVRQLIERHGRGLGISHYDDALAWMVEDSQHAVKAHDARGGGEVWVGRRPWRIRYVIGSPMTSAPNPLPPVVTVLSNERKSSRSSRSSRRAS